MIADAANSAGDIFASLMTFIGNKIASTPEDSDHNFGHGKKHLSSLLMTLNLLAFLFHTTLEFTDKKYRILREDMPRRVTFFDHIRSLTCYLFFKSWDDLIDFMIEKAYQEKKNKIL